MENCTEMSIREEKFVAKKQFNLICNKVGFFSMLDEEAFFE
jgi:hypothetical protein